jgi:RNA polymerase sigma-70 factor, ECF subfamily
VTAALAMDYVEIDRPEALSPDEFEEFYTSTRRVLRSYLCRLTFDETIADDFLQESYIRLLNAPPLRPEQRKSYLYRTATNLVTDYRRAQSRRRRWWQKYGGSDRSPDAKLDLSSDMHRLFARLNTQEQALLWLAYVEGAEHKEIAEILKLREKSVKVLLYRARRRMEAILRKNGFEGGSV